MAGDVSLQMALLLVGLSVAVAVAISLQRKASDSLRNNASAQTMRCCMPIGAFIHLVLQLVLFFLVPLIVIGAGIVFISGLVVGALSGSAIGLWLGAAFGLVAAPFLISGFLRREQLRAKYAAWRARAALLKHGPVNQLNMLGYAQPRYVALKPGVLLWWKDREAFGTNGGDPNNGQELGRLELRGASLTRPKPLRLEIRTAGQDKSVLSFADNAALLVWEVAIRRAVNADALEHQLQIDLV